MASPFAVVREEFVCNTGEDEMLKTLECRDIPIFVSLDDQTHLRNLVGATPQWLLVLGEVNLRHLVTLTSTTVSPMVAVPVGIFFAVEHALVDAPADAIEGARESAVN
ncbi:hypothetical protein V6N12_046554 [Hibiscus sabdariffa]|uniref:Uncharacterized protein n=1 Tax=Hibiscus sabdariffa TaxID=183260 RepID=A0ABR2DIZ0_9ROSI